MDSLQWCILMCFTNSGTCRTGMLNFAAVYSSKCVALDEFLTTLMTNIVYLNINTSSMLSIINTTLYEKSYLSQMQHAEPYLVPIQLQSFQHNTVFFRTWNWGYYWKEHQFSRFHLIIICGSKQRFSVLCMVKFFLHHRWAFFSVHSML